MVEILKKRYLDMNKAVGMYNHSFWVKENINGHVLVNKCQKIEIIKTHKENNGKEIQWF